MDKPNLSLKIYKKVSSVPNYNTSANLYPDRIQNRYNSLEKREGTVIEISNDVLYENDDVVQVRAYLGGVLFFDNVDISVEKESWYSLECWVFTNDFSADDNDIINGLTQRLGICINKPYPYQNYNDYLANNDFGVSKIGVRIEKEIQGFGFDSGVWVKIRTCIYTNQEDLLKYIGVYYHDNRKKTTKLDTNLDFIIDYYDFYFANFIVKKIEEKPIFEILEDNAFIEVSIKPEDVTINKSFENLQGVNKNNSEYSKTINVPATPEIKKFFSFFQETNNANSARTQYKAILCSDTIPLIEGDINGFESYSQRNNNKEQGYYSVFIKEKLKTWVEILDKKNLKDLKNLDFQTFTIDAIVKTFYNNGDSYTTDKTDEIYSSLVTFAYFLYGENSFNNFTIDLNDLRPHFFIKPLINKIFNTIGFNVEYQGFLASDEFRDMVYAFNQDKFLLSDDKKMSGVNRFMSYFTSKNKVLIDTIISETPATEQYQFRDRVRSYKINFNLSDNIPDIDNFRNDTDNIFEAINGRFYSISEGKYKFRMKIMLEYGYNFATSSDTLNKEVFLDFEVDLFECDYIEFFIHHFQNTSNINLIQGTGINDPNYYSCDYLRFCYSIRGGTNKYIKFKYTSEGNLNNNRLYDYFITRGLLTTVGVDNNAANIFYRNVLTSNPSQYFPDGGYQKSGFSSVYGQAVFRFYRARVLSGSWLQAELVGEHSVKGGGKKLLKLPINDYLPDISQLEFLKSLADVYDLFFDTNEKTKTIKIYTFQEYIQSLNKNKDWTEKIDEKNINKKPYSDTSFDYLLSYAENNDDSTIKLQDELALNKYKTRYGADLVISANSNKEQKRVNQNNIFYATAMTKIAEDFYLPTSEKNEIGHRLLRYLGLIRPPSRITTRILYGCGNGISKTVEGYPAMTFEGLNYRTIDSVIGLRERFWNNRISLLQKSVVLEAWFWLELLDILNVDFSVPIKIENDYWLIQKIKDFPATLEKTTKVELLRLV